jgi:hypothetical protein
MKVFWQAPNDKVIARKLERGAVGRGDLAGF